MADTKYLVYKVSGGINHMLNQINNCVHVAKLTKRILIIDCLGGGAFKSDFNKYFNIPNYKYFTDYSRMHDEYTLDKSLYMPYINASAGLKGMYYVNDKLASLGYNALLNSNEKIIYCSYVTGIGGIPWYIKANKDIVDKISENRITEKYIGFHYRNTDMKTSLEAAVPQLMGLFLQTKNIYLGTDDYTAYDRLNTLTDNKFNIIQYTKPFNNKGDNIHYGNPNKDEVIINALTDMYHLVHATFFIPSGKSSFSKRIIVLRGNDNFFK